MSQVATPAELRADAYRELTQHILPYWAEKTVDETHGGFIGRIGSDNQVDANAPKGLVLNARILWTFAESALYLEDESYGHLADRAGAYLQEFFWDVENGGAFWMLNNVGEVLESKKLTYAQAFLLYAITAWYRLTGDRELKAWAEELFYLIEAHTADTVHEGYFEVYDENWRRLNKERLSEKDPVADKSSNTQLHVLEAYAALCRIWKGDEVVSRLKILIQQFLSKIIDPHTHQMHGAFATDWEVLTDTISFGHDIEASWLLLDAAQSTRDKQLIEQVQSVALKMVDRVLQEGIAPDGSILNEMKHGVLDHDRHWWPQAEAVVGFLNAYELTKKDLYMQAAMNTWNYIQSTIIDHDAGEWFFRVDKNGRPSTKENKVGPWKCPYHNARACIEIVRRLDTLT